MECEKCLILKERDLLLQKQEEDTLLFMLILSCLMLNHNIVDVLPKIKGRLNVH